MCLNPLVQPVSLTTNTTVPCEAYPQRLSTRVAAPCYRPIRNCIRIGLKTTHSPSFQPPSPRPPIDYYDYLMKYDRYLKESQLLNCRIRFSTRRFIRAHRIFKITLMLTPPLSPMNPPIRLRARRLQVILILGNFVAPKFLSSFGPLAGVGVDATKAAVPAINPMRRRFPEFLLGVGGSRTARGSWTTSEWGCAGVLAFRVWGRHQQKDTASPA
ncbi:hypothetical protein GALMADRAFT_409288 [Galerina marginata CBS 339.88]|uniref:Uncharacterized protein n=1 Tax=Galerina marginata (strain CBS 339.88) TaxID=685588 RepID=A0A067T3A7_GALM3|nr:hypothetical protein GALMADRAFT_409288 [Galerina marginata CBS 339.88]